MFMQFSDNEKANLKLLGNYVDDEHPEYLLPANITFEYLATIITLEQQQLVNNLHLIDPLQYGFKGEYLGEEPVPPQFHIIKGQRVKIGDRAQTLRDVYLPILIWESFHTMQVAFVKSHP